MKDTYMRFMAPVAPGTIAGRDFLVTSVIPLVSCGLNIGIGHLTGIEEEKLKLRRHSH